MDAESVVIGYAMGYNDGLADASGDDKEFIEDWQPPADWISVPDPAPNEIYVLVEVIDDTFTNFVNFESGFKKPENGWGGMGALSIDWGDGEAYSYKQFEWDRDDNLQHTYSDTGQYLIKVTTEIGENNVFAKFLNYDKYNPSEERSNVLICKTGADIVFAYNGDTSASNLYFGKKITYFKHLGAGILPRYFAQNWYGLVKIEFAEPVKEIPDNAFQFCYALRVFDTSEVLTIGTQALQYQFGRINSFPKCKEIGDYSLGYLSKINIPMCESIGQGTFANCFIKEINIPKCKSIGSGAFTGCYALEKADISACETLGNLAFSEDYNLSDVTVSNDCSFGNNCFQQCYKLYPRPDGSTN